MLDITSASIIQRALGKEGVARHWLVLTDDPLRDTLQAHGLTLAGAVPRFVSDAEPLWLEWVVTDRAKAEAALATFRQSSTSIDFTLSRQAGSQQFAEYRCPKCGSTHIYIEDSDTVGVPVLPEGIESYGDIEANLSAGECSKCGAALYAYEFGFSTVPNPDGDEHFCVLNLQMVPDRVERFEARCPALASPWTVTRMFFDTGIWGLEDIEEPPAPVLPKGPFVVDFHQFGPFLLDRPGLAGCYGVAPYDGGPGSEWATGAELFRSLAGSAMAKLRAAAARTWHEKPEALGLG